MNNQEWYYASEVFKIKGGSIIFELFESYAQGFVYTDSRPNIHLFEQKNPNGISSLVSLTF